MKSTNCYNFFPLVRIGPKDQNCFIAPLNLYCMVIRRMFRHFEEEIIIEYYECIDYERKADVLCLDLFSNGSESTCICRSLCSFRRCVVSKDNNLSEINNYLSCT